MDLHLRDLRFFEIVADLGHLGRAAEQLGRTQPALSKCIQRLELTVGGALFERAGRGIRLTPAPTVQVDACSIPLLPRMVAKTDLLTFVSRHTLRLERSRTLREVRLPATTLRRHLGVTCRRDGYLSPAARHMLELLRADGQALFGEDASPLDED